MPAKRPQLPVIVIAGPTASGKTELAIAVAQKIHAEIISADSRQCYRYMDIGTAKPTPEQRRSVVHHLVDILDPDQEFSAGHFARQARELIGRLRRQNSNAVVAGGSGMYITALLDGFFTRQVSDKALQAALKQQAAKEGPRALYRRLQEVDPERAAELHANDVHRIVRALEVYYATGIPISQLRRQPRVPAPFPFKLFGISWPRQVLYQRIEARVDWMLRAGLQREVEQLLARGYSPELNALQTLGYREMIQYLRGELSYEETVALIKQHTRNFAKRQLTWFRRDPRIHWLNAPAAQDIDALADHLLEQL